MSPGALRAIADVAEALSRLAREAAIDTSGDRNAMIPLARAAELAGTSVRVVRDAIRAGALPAFGRQRDRCVRCSDLDAWVDSRRLRPVAGVDDRDIEARMAWLGQLRAKGP